MDAHNRHRCLAGALIFLLRFRFVRRVAYFFFVTLVRQAPDSFAHELASAHIAERRDILLGEILKLHPAVVEYALFADPKFALRQLTYSQEGEDLVLARIFEGKKDGFYVDVGAHHPIRFSNTYLLYCEGWRGINIDAALGSMTEFRLRRPNDVNLECFVSTSAEPQTFFVFNEPALNTGVKDIAQQRSVENGRYKVEQTIEVVPRTLASILDEHLPHGRQIDVLNVDVEGFDLDVLKSNDWQKYRPSVILAELLPVTEAVNADDHPIAQYLQGMGYRVQSRFFNTVIFRAVGS